MNMIKVAEGTYSIANKGGFLKVYLAWCELKSYNQQGSFRRSKSELSKVSEFIGKSLPTLRVYLRKLVELGLIRRSRYSYCLVSYDKAWGILGKKMDENPKKDRLGNFIIFKFKDKENLKEQIELSEIQIHTQRQAYKAKSSILKDKSKHFTDTEINALKSCRLIDLQHFLDELYIKKLTVLSNVKRFLENIDHLKFCKLQGKKYSYLKITPFLTCKRTSVILGYEKNSRMGQNIRRRIESAGLARFITRDIEFLNTVPWDNAIIGEKMLEKAPNRISHDGRSLSIRAISNMVIL